jgi:chorismate--pyruvate lyase
LIEPVSKRPGAEPHWRPLSTLSATSAPRAVRGWLADAGSLTRRLEAACGGAFNVRLLHQGWGRPEPGEARLLATRRTEAAMLREVGLYCGSLPWVFARTVMPARSLRGPLQRLANLGNRPLGAVLFADPGMRRGPTQVARLAPGQGLFEAAASVLEDRPEVLWGRRCLFFLSGRPLLVNEIFLPGAPPAPDRGGFV